MCSGSLDYLQGGPFAFVAGLDAVGAWPPIRESHVEMDAAWALYEAWVAIQTGEVDSALDLRLRQVVARRPARDHGVAARPVLRAAAVAVDGRHGRAAGERVPRRERRDREGPRRGRGPFAAQRAEQSERGAQGQRDRRRGAEAAGHAPSAARRRHLPDHRRLRGHRDRGRRSRPQGVEAAGVDPRHRAPHRGAQSRRARPHAFRVDPRRRRRGRGRRTATSTSPSCTRSSVTRS